MALIKLSFSRERPERVNEVHLLCHWRHLGVKLQQEALMARILWSSLTFWLKHLIGCRCLQTHQECSSFSQSVSDDIYVSDRYTKVPDQPHHLLLLGGEPSEHQLRRDVEPSRHHAVEEGTLHHLRRGNGQHPGARCRGQVCAGGGSTMFVDDKGMRCAPFIKPVK